MKAPWPMAEILVPVCIVGASAVGAVELRPALLGARARCCGSRWRSAPPSPASRPRRGSPRRRAGRSCRSCAPPRPPGAAGSAARAPSSSFWTRICPSAVSAIVSGSSCSEGSGAAAVFGSSIGTPTVSSGAATMKMMRSTSITSTIGVTLISAIGRRRTRRPPRARPEPCSEAPMSGRRPVELPRQDHRELVREALVAADHLVGVLAELVVEDRPPGSRRAGRARWRAAPRRCRARRRRGSSTAGARSPRRRA